MKYKAVFFDADGLLIKRKYLFSERLHQEYGVDMEKMKSFFTGIFRECGVGKADLKIELAKVIGAWGWQGTVDELLQYWFTAGTECDSEVLAFIHQLRANGTGTYMTSDQEKYRGEHLRKQLSEYFDNFFFSGEIGYRKKDQEFWQYSFSKCQLKFPGIQKEDILVVDDGEGNIESARQLGLSGYVYDGELEKLKEYIYKKQSLT